MSDRRVTMKDIAEKIGVDRSTVSLALKDDPRISQATRDKVQAVAKEMGYRPDPAFKILSSQRWKSHENNTGFVIAFIATREQLDAPNTQGYLAGARSKAEQLGFGFSEFNLSTYDSIEKANQVLLNRGVRGLIFFQPSNSEILKGFDWERFSSISLKGAPSYSLLNTVEHDRSTNLQALWQEAVKRGAARIGTILLKQTASDDPSQVMGALQYQQYNDAQKGLSTLPPYFYDVASSPTRNKQDLNDWLSTHKPQVIIGENDDVFEMLTQTGLRIPEQASFLSLQKRSRTFPFPLEESGISGIELNVEKTGEMAAKLLSRQIQNNERGLPELRMTHLIQTDFVEGRTFAKRFT